MFIVRLRRENSKWPFSFTVSQLCHQGMIKGNFLCENTHIVFWTIPGFCQRKAISVEWNKDHPGSVGQWAQEGYGPWSEFHLHHLAAVQIPTQHWHYNRPRENRGVSDRMLSRSMFDLLFDLCKCFHFYLNNHTFQLKISIWFFVKSASPCPLPSDLLCVFHE